MLPTISHPTDRPNFTEVEVGNLTIWYSYSTPIAFKVAGMPTVVRENDWSNTTGRHLGYVERQYGLDRSQRITGETFESAIEEATNRLIPA